MRYTKAEMRRRREYLMVARLYLCIKELEGSYFKEIFTTFAPKVSEDVFDQIECAVPLRDVDKILRFGLKTLKKRLHLLHMWGLIAIIKPCHDEFILVKTLPITEDAVLYPFTLMPQESKVYLRKIAKRANALQNTNNVKEETEE